MICVSVHKLPRMDLCSAYRESGKVVRGNVTIHSAHFKPCGYFHSKWFWGVLWFSHQTLLFVHFTIPACMNSAALALNYDKWSVGKVWNLNLHSVWVYQLCGVSQRWPLFQLKLFLFYWRLTMKEMQKDLHIDGTCSQGILYVICARKGKRKILLNAITTTSTQGILFQ